MRHCKFLRTFLLSSFFLFFFCTVSYADIIICNDFDYSFASIDTEQSNSNTGKNTLRVTGEEAKTFKSITLYLNTNKVPTVFKIMTSGISNNDFTFKFYLDDVLQFKTSTVNSYKIVSKEFQCNKIIIEKNTDLEFSSFYFTFRNNALSSSYNILNYDFKSNVPDPPVIVPPATPSVPDVPDVNFNLQGSSLADVSENIVNSIEKFFSNLIKYGIFIISLAIGLGIIFIGGKWLWVKVKFWLFSV